MSSELLRFGVKRGEERTKGLRVRVFEKVRLN